MKFFIFTCLLAVAFAKQDICSASCEETTKTIKDTEYSSSSSSEEPAAIPTQDKISQFYQKLNFLQILQALYQNQIAMSQWDQSKTSVYPFINALNKEQLSTTEETSQKSVEMDSTEVFTEKTEMTEEKKNSMEILSKMSQYYQKFILPQYFKTIRQYQTPMNTWTHFKPNPYQFVPTMNYF